MHEYVFTLGSSYRSAHLSKFPKTLRGSDKKSDLWSYVRYAKSPNRRTGPIHLALRTVRLGRFQDFGAGRLERGSRSRVGPEKHLIPEVGDGPDK